MKRVKFLEYKKAENPSHKRYPDRPFLSGFLLPGRYFLFIIHCIVR